MNTQASSVARAANFHKLCKDDRGLSTVEYVVILVLIAVAAIGTWKNFGGTIMTKVANQGTAISDMKGADTPTK